MCDLLLPQRSQVNTSTWDFEDWLVQAGRNMTYMLVRKERQSQLPELVCF